MEVIKSKELNRYTIVNLLDKNNNIGLEIGVAEGFFSIAMMNSNKFKLFYGIDSYDSFPHTDIEFRKTKKKLSKFSNYKLIKKEFNDSLELFKDNYFDFIYIDGFAHTGNDEGQTLTDWFSKVKLGGIIAGDDYHSDWPLVKKTVNEFITKHKFKLFVTEIEDHNSYSQYPSWYFIKNIEINQSLLQLKKTQKLHKRNFKSENKTIFFIKKYKVQFYYFIKKILGKKIFYYILINYHKIFKN